MTNFSCREDSRNIPSQLRRDVRQASLFGCSSCGCPIIESHHIIPFAQVQEHRFDNLVALCPTCHQRADEGGQWSPDLVRQFKSNPYNSDATKDRFIVSADDFIIQIGWIEFHITGKLISIRDEPMLECSWTDEGIVLVSGQFHAREGQLIAIIQENEWQVLVDQAWDIEFIAARTLIVRTGPREIILRMKMSDNVLEIQQCFFIRDHLKFMLRGNDQNTHLEIEATNTFFRSENERVVFPGPVGAINIV